jgi:NAD(P)-dependent dehydrogenase (short-subunit alcohol dehydrogenase family)
MRLDGRTVLVVGAAGTIGAEVCRALLREGARVGAVDYAEAPLKDLEPGSGGGHLHTEACDAADVTAVGAVAERIEAALGPIDALVNVAGYWDIVDFSESDPAHWDAMIRANLITALATCRTIVPAMVQRQAGAVVNFASTAGEYGSIRPSAAYAAAKGGVIAFSKSLAREVSPHGVRVNVVSPGPVETPMLRAATAQAREEAAARTLLGRLGTAADIAAGVCYLVSDDASWVTGEVLRVNGGSLI